MIVQSGRPFNITLGRDINGDTFNTERPSLAPAGTVCDDSNKALFRCTPFGNFKLTFAPGDVMIPRNFGEGPVRRQLTCASARPGRLVPKAAVAMPANRIGKVSATRVVSVRSWAAAACVVRVVVAQVVQAAAGRAVVVLVDREAAVSVVAAVMAVTT